MLKVRAVYPKERAVMQNERRKRKRKARAANKEHKRKALVALEDERAMTLAKNESLLRLARKYYAKWHVLHLRQRVGTTFDVNRFVLASTTAHYRSKRTNTRTPQ